MIRSAKQSDPAIAFMRLIWQLDHELRSTSKRMERRFGITGPQRLVLLLLAQHRTMTAGGLAASLHIHPSTLTGVLNRLVRKRLIRSESDPLDGRVSVLTLRQEGLAFLKQREGTVEEAVRVTLKKIGGSDIEAAGRVLSMLAKELAKEERPVRRRKATQRGKKS